MLTGAKIDCFAYRPGQRAPRRKAECTALDDLYCKYGKCRFYKDKNSGIDTEGVKNAQKEG